MHKNPYFRQVLRRHNVISEAFFAFFLRIASWNRLLLEVFIRKNFGDRYFSLSTAIILVAAAVFAPYVMIYLTIPARYIRDITLWDTIKERPSVYIFLGIFLGVSIWQYILIKRGTSVFNFQKFSLYSGDINQLFFKIKLFGKEPTIRLIETVYEPLFFLLIGWLLMKIGLDVGSLIMVLSVWYSLGYVASYKVGDDFIKDKIDEMICNEDMEEVFVDNLPHSPRRFEFRGERPDSRAQRQVLADALIEDEDVGKIS